MKFYTTFTYQIELLPRITIIYGKGETDGVREIIQNGFAMEWLWFGMYFEL